jgi:glycosyltransferase involved in cell wall biosynthesis
LIEEPIRILRVIARLNIGGPAIQAVTLSGLLSKGRFRTRLVCGQVGAHEGDMSYLASSMQVDPVIVPSLGREISAFDDLCSFSELRKIISEFKPHVIHTHTAKAGTLGRLAGISVNAQRIFGRKIRLVHTFHGHVFHSYFSPLKTWAFMKIERFLAHFTDRIIVISATQEKDICERYRIVRPRQVQVVPLGFDLSGFERLGPPPSQGIFSVGIIGRLTPVKNHRMLFEAVRILKDQGKDHSFNFVVVGDGELRETLTREAAALGIGKRVVFTGWQKEMPEVYGKLDVVVLTSLNEGTPVSLIEAMAGARPVIATDVGGVRDLMGEIDPSTALKPRPSSSPLDPPQGGESFDVAQDPEVLEGLVEPLGAARTSNGSGSTLSERRAEARGSRWVDTETGEGYKLARHGILVPSGDSRAMAKALLFAVTERRLTIEMAERARRHVLQTYSLERLVGDLTALYEGLIKG